VNDWGERLIDVILAVIIGIIALVAIMLIPSNEVIKNNQASKYKSSKVFIFAAGGLALFMGVFIIITYASSKEEQTIFNILWMAAFMVLGIALIGVNIKKAKFLTQCESGAVAEVAEVAAVEVAGQVVAAPQTQVQQPMVAQTQVIAQQVAVQPTVVPQQVVAQPQAAAVPVQPKAPAKSRIVVIKCPKCKGDMQINTAMLGQKIKCPHCGVEGKIG
jgi:cell division protein FtsW (lipid II flippase)/ribosomal protein S27E